MTRAFELEELALQINLTFQAAKSSIFQLATLCAKADDDLGTAAHAALMEIIDLQANEFSDLAIVGHQLLWKRVNLFKMLPEPYHKMTEPRECPRLAFRYIKRDIFRQLPFEIKSEADLISELNRIVAVAKADALEGVPEKLHNIRWPYPDEDLLITDKQNHSEMKLMLEKVGLAKFVDQFEKMKEEFDAENGVASGITKADERKRLRKAAKGYPKQNRKKQSGLSPLGPLGMFERG